MRTFICAIIICLLSTICLFAQSSGPAIEWTETYGSFQAESCQSVKEISTGGYILGGVTKSFGAGLNDFYIINIDTEGNVIWEKTYGGSKDDWCLDIDATTDGGFIAVGYTESFGSGKRDMYIVRLDSNGDSLWARVIGGIEHDFAESVDQTDDGGFVVLGTTSSAGAGYQDMYLVKLSVEGEVEWSRTFGGIWSEFGKSVTVTNDGGFILAGSDGSFGVQGDVYIIKTDTEGNEEWTKLYGGEGYQEAISIQQTSDGGYIVGGNKAPDLSYNYDMYVLRLDSNGDTLWTKTYGKYDISSIIETVDGGFVFIGDDTQWGNTTVMMKIVKINQDGDIIWEDTYGSQGIENGLDIIQTSDNGYLAVGSTTSFGAGSLDFYIVKLGEDSTVDVGDSDEKQYSFTLDQNYPNPFNPSTIISYSLAKDGFATLNVYTIAGELVETLRRGYHTRGQYQVEFIGQNLTSGLYIYSLTIGDKKLTRKMLLIK